MEFKDIFLGPDEFYNVDFKKTIIYLHHTAGSCFVGETLISLADGSDVRMDRLETGKKYWVYGCDENGNIKIVNCTALGETKKVNELIEITLDNGITEKCTLDHLWMMRDGTYKKAEELNEGDSLMPLYKRLDYRGYEEIKNNFDDKWYKTHQLSGKIKYGDNIYKNKKKMVLHHIDFDKLNNDPENLLLMEKDEHIMFHANLMKENWANDEWKLKMRSISSENMKNVLKNNLEKENYKIFLSELLKKRWENGDFDYQIGSTLSSETKNKISKALTKKCNEDSEWAINNKNTKSELLKEMWKDDEYRAKMINNSKELWKNEEYRNKVFKFDSEISKNFWKNQEFRDKVSKAVSERNKLYALYKKSESFDKISYKDWKLTYNHKIIKISKVELEEQIPVYDVYSPETKNFVLSSGVFVHNSIPDWVVAAWDKDANEDGTPRKVATSFVVGGISTRDNDSTWDGVIVRAFPETKWAYHLGAKNTNGLYDKMSIAVEICNYGPLTLSKTGQFMNYVNTPVPTDQVVELAQPFRGFKYYHRYTDKQLDSVRNLMIYLSTTYGINLKLGLQEWINKENVVMPSNLPIIEQQKWLNRFGFVGLNGRPLDEDGVWGDNSAWAVQSVGKSAFEFNPLTYSGYPGLWTHSNIRTDKTDTNPQPNLISMIKSL